MQKWEYCRVHFKPADSFDGHLTLDYFGPGGAKRHNQDFKAGRETDVQALFDNQVVRLLNEGWEPIPTEQWTTLHFKRPYQGT